MKLKYSLLSGFLILASVIAGAKNSVPLSLPSGTIEGFLPNGLHYIIKQNDLPRHNVECRLVMNVGSINETIQQRGVAHFLEHMAFKGSEHFPNRSVIDYFERQGMKYGRDINAFTGFDRTIYWFTLPIDKYSTDIIDSTLLAVGDVLSSLHLEESRAKRERGIILEELRDYDAGDPFYSLKMGNSLYSLHMPLGRKEDIEAINRSTLCDFYNKWYSPMNATVIIVGDVDAVSVEKKIKAMLSPVGNRETTIKLPVIPMDYESGIHVMQLCDSLRHDIKLDLMIPHVTDKMESADDMSQKAIIDMIVDMMNNRMTAHGMKAMVADHWYLGDKNHFSFTTDGASKGNILAAVEAFSSELKALAKKGPSAEELQWAVNIRKSKTKVVPSKMLSTEWIDNFIDYAILGDRKIYTDADLQQVKSLLDGTTVAQVKAKAKELLGCAEKVMLAGIDNDGSDGGKITSSDIKKAWNSGKSSQAKLFILQKEEPVVNESSVEIPQLLLATHPYNDNMIIKETHYKEVGIDEIVLANGLRLLLKPTVDDDESMSIMAVGRGGIADVPDSLYNHFKDAVAYVDMGGIATIDHDTLSSVMVERGIMMNVGIENYWHQAMATSAPKDAQVMMNILYEKFHHPGKDKESFDISVQDELDSYGKETTLGQIMKRDQARVINNTVDSLFGNAVKAQFIPYTKDDIRRLNLDDMTVFYKRLFTNPSGLTLIVTGNYPVDSIRRMAVATFSRMKAPEKPLALRNEKFSLPKKGATLTFPSDDSTKAVCNLVFANNYEPSLKNTLMFKLMRDIMQKRVLAVLREHLNIVYSPFVDAQYHGTPQDVCMFRLFIDVANSNYPVMLNEMKKIVEELRTQPVDNSELEKIKRSFIVTKRQALTDVAPAEWKRCLTELIKNGETVADYNNYDDILHGITPQDVLEGFKKYVDFNKLVVLVQKDEKVN